MMQLPNGVGRRHYVFQDHASRIAEHAENQRLLALHRHDFPLNGNE
jgi:hypothetical protein